MGSWARWRKIALAFALAGVTVSCGGPVRSHLAASRIARDSAVRPLDNSCDSGSVAFTFDDGPGPHTAAVLAALERLRLHATFFVLGNKIAGNSIGQQIIRDEAAHGFSVQDHTYDHASLTGASTGSAPLTAAQIGVELAKTSAVIQRAGLPRPTLYRPPYGDVSAFADNVARGLGYRIVMPWSRPGGNIVDSQDWTGASTAQIVKNVTIGSTATATAAKGSRPGLAPDAIVAMHDGDTSTTLNALAALQPIVDYMNAHGYCSAATIRTDATGGVVPPPAPVIPSKGNVVRNPALQTLSSSGVPLCFERAGSLTARNSAVWSSTRDAGAGSVTQTVAVTGWTGGDRKLVIDQSTSRSTCAPQIHPGGRMALWIRYRGTWGDTGKAPAKVSLVTYYRTGAGTSSAPFGWVYWQTSPVFPASPSWTTAYFQTARAPAGANALSYGLTLSGNGTLTIGDFAAVPD